MSEKILYICPTCFTVCQTPAESHRHVVIPCYVGSPGDLQRRPMTDRFGSFVSRAPRRYLEARRLIPAWTPIDPNLLDSTSNS